MPPDHDIQFYGLQAKKQNPIADTLELCLFNPCLLNLFLETEKKYFSPFLNTEITYEVAILLNNHNC